MISLCKIIGHSMYSGDCDNITGSSICSREGCGHKELGIYWPRESSAPEMPTVKPAKEIMAEIDGYFCKNCKAICNVEEPYILCICDGGSARFGDVENYPSDWVEVDVLVTSR